MYSFLIELAFFLAGFVFAAWIIVRVRSLWSLVLASVAGFAICYGGLIAFALHAASDPEYDGFGAAMFIFFGWAPAMCWVLLLTLLKIADLWRTERGHH